MANNFPFSAMFTLGGVNEFSLQLFEDQRPYSFICGLRSISGRLSDHGHIQKLSRYKAQSIRRHRREFQKKLSFLFNSLPTLETAQPEVGSSGWKSTARRVVSGAFPVALEIPEDRVLLTPGRTHNRIRSPS
ncbi:hypothetical protein YC2023_072308 [Brassica napus]